MSTIHIEKVDNYKNDLEMSCDNSSQDLFLHRLPVLIPPFPGTDSVDCSESAGKMKLIVISDSGTDLSNG